MRTGIRGLVVNNAGMSPLYESLTKVTEALYDKVLEVNLREVERLYDVSLVNPVK